MSQQLSDALADEAQRLEVELDPQVATALVRYFDTLSRWAQRIRVSGATDSLVLIRRHFADSLALSRMMPDASPLRCIDVGSGGGLPGLPTALLRPDLQITLIEVNARKCAMLRTAIHDLGLSCEVSINGWKRCPWTTASPLTWPGHWLPLLPRMARAWRELIESGGRVVVFTARPRPSAAPAWLTPRP